MKPATLSGGGPSHPEALQDAALLHFFEEDRRPTFILDLKNSTCVYQNPAYEDIYPESPPKKWTSTLKLDVDNSPNVWTFGGKIWTSTLLYQKWVVFSTCCRRDEVGPLINKPLSRTTPTEENNSAVCSNDHHNTTDRSEGKPVFASTAQIEDMRKLETSINESLDTENVSGPPISLAQYRMSFETAPVGIYATDCAGNPLFCNEQYYKIIGKPKKADAIPVFFESIHPNDVERVKLAKRQAMITKKPVTLEYRLKRPWNTVDPVSGKEILTDYWLLGTITPWIDDVDPEKIHYLNGWLINISAQRYHEKVRVVAAQQTRIEQRFAGMADSAPVGMYLFKPDMSPMYLNKACFDIYGTNREEYMKVDDLRTRLTDFVHQDSLEDVRVATAKVMAGEPTKLTYRLKKPHKYTDPSTGEELEGPTWVHSFSVAEVDESGEVICMQGFVEDVSAKRLSEQLLKQRLEEALETKRQADRFIDMTSHELRNPLSAILQSSDGILAEFEKSGQNGSLTLAADTVDTVVNLAQTIIHCAQHQKTIVDDILTLSKLDSNLLVISPDQVAIPSLIDRCFKMYAAETEAAQIQATLAVDTNYKELVKDRAVMLDSSRVLQIVINLFSNAIKFSKFSTTRKITVSLGASKDRPSRPCFTEARRNLTDHTLPESEWGSGQEVYIQITVADTGRGIDHAEQSQLFQRFHQASPKTYKQYGGSGLGLYISQSLTELQGGQIGVESDGVGKGCRFIFYIKARLCATAAPEPEQVSRHAHSISRTLSPTNSPAPNPAHRRISTSFFSDLHVLVAEDNVINQRVMSQQLQRFGCVVHVANHGLEALNFLQQTTFFGGPSSSSATPIPLSVILMDVEMPVLNGLDSARRIRQLQKEGKVKGHVPIIAITANARTEQIKTALEAGVDDVVTKPFRVSDLVPRMRELVEKTARAE